MNLVRKPPRTKTVANWKVYNAIKLTLTNFVIKSEENSKLFLFFFSILPSPQLKLSLPLSLSRCLSPFSFAASLSSLGETAFPERKIKVLFCLGRWTDLAIYHMKRIRKRKGDASFSSCSHRCCRQTCRSEPQTNSNTEQEIVDEIVDGIYIWGDTSESTKNV